MAAHLLRIHWAVPIALVAVMLGSCRSSAPLASGPEQVRSASAGRTVWTVDFMTVLPGDQERYRRFVEANWAKARRTAKARGEIDSYHALFLPDTTSAGWHVILLTEYPDSAAYERREAIFQPILTAQGHTRIDGKSTRELTSRVDHHLLVRLFGEP